MTVTLIVKNIERMTGKEVVQQYLSTPSKNTDKPSSELKAFGKTNLLQSGESQRITLTLTQLAGINPSSIQFSEFLVLYVLVWGLQIF